MHIIKRVFCVEDLSKEEHFQIIKSMSSRDMRLKVLSIKRPP